MQGISRVPGEARGLFVCSPTRLINNPESRLLNPSGTFQSWSKKQQVIVALPGTQNDSHTKKAAFVGQGGSEVKCDL